MVQKQELRHNWSGPCKIPISDMSSHGNKYEFFTETQICRAQRWTNLMDQEGLEPSKFTGTGVSRVAPSFVSERLCRPSLGNLGFC